MATYKVYNYGIPKGSYKDYLPEYTQYSLSKPKSSYNYYMPEYTKYEYKRPDDVYSDSKSAYAKEINAANARLNNLEINKPSGYVSAYGSQINQLINNMANRKFSYDVNADALYNQYKDNYIKQGQQAMADTMAQAAALTGGYGNSYAATVGNQAYQSYLGQLNDRIPELYKLALDKYNSESADMQNLYSMMANQEGQEYSKYRDNVADYQADRGYYDQQLQNLRAMGQNLWGQNWDNYWNAAQQTEQNRQNAVNTAFNQLNQNWSNYWNAAERNDQNRQNAINTALSLYGQDWDNYRWAENQNQHNYEQAIAEDQWNANFAENQRQFNENQAQAAAQAAAELAYQREKASAAATSSSGSGSKSSASGSNTSGLSSNYSKVRNNILSSYEFYNSRISNRYQSYQDYVKAKIDGDKSLTDAERLQLIQDFRNVLY
jgi:hypothetical protein